MFHKTLVLLFTFLTLQIAQALEGGDLSQLGHATEYTCIVSIKVVASSYNPHFIVTQHCDSQVDPETVATIPAYQGDRRLDMQHVQLEVINQMRGNYELKTMSNEKSDDNDSFSSLVFQKK